MKLQRLRLINYRRHADTLLEFPEGVIALVGANGAGKSTLLEAIAFALYGTDALATPKPLVRFDGAATSDTVRVELDFTVAGSAVHVVRELRGKLLTPQAELHVDGHVVVPPAAGSGEAATQSISRLLGMDLEAFLTTVVARQGELSRLSDAKPAERKRMVLRMLGIDRVDAAIERARLERRVAAEKLDALRSVLADESVLRNAITAAKGLVSNSESQHRQATASWELAQRELTSTKRAHEAMQAQLVAARDADAAFVTCEQDVRHRAEIAGQWAKRLHAARQAQDLALTLKNAAARVAELEQQEADARVRAGETVRYVADKKRYDAYAARKAQLEAALAKALPNAPDVAGLTSRLEGLQTKAERLAASLEASRARLEDARMRKATLARLGPEAPCPTCLRPLQDSAEHLVRQHEDDEGRLVNDGEALWRLVQTARAERDELAKQLREAQKQYTLVEGAKREQASLHGELERLLADAPTLPPPPAPVPSVAEFAKALAQARHDASQFLVQSALAKEIPTLTVESTAAEANLALARSNLETARRRKAELEPDPKVVTAAVHAFEAAQSKERAAERLVAQASQTVATAKQSLDTAEKAWLDGLEKRQQADALATVLSHWNALAAPRTGLLDQFRDHLVSRIGPAIQAESGRLMSAFTAGRYSDIVLDTEYEVYVQDGGQRYTLSRFSGGERDLVHLALRLAVSRLLAERSGSEMRFLALDEVFGSLDRNRRDLVVGALHGLGGLYAQVLVVSHLESVQEALDHALNLELQDGVSRLRNT